MQVQFLGTGTSVGVPQIGCTCPVCTSADPRDRRRRCALHVRTPRVSFLVDTPPELREACLAYGIDKVQAVLITHAHMDHVAGFDDVRRFNTLNGGVPMRCYGAPETLDALHRIFPYISEKPGRNGLFRPQISFTPVEGPFDLADVRVTPLPVEHGPRTNGWLFERDGRRFAYISDCHVIPESTLALVEGVDVMVLNCLKPAEHPTHLNEAAALEYMARIRPARGYFVHMSHSMSHAAFDARLPPHLHPAHDGLVLEV